MNTAWLDGRFVEDDDPALTALPDPAVHAICCTSARVEAGSVRHEARHLDRLVRDARTLGCGEIDPLRVAHALREIAQAAFGDTPGIVRLAVYPGEGAPHLLGNWRPLGADKPTWTALTCPSHHPGPGDHLGAKLVYFSSYERARRHSTTFGADESLLVDEQGRVVEGGRSNLLVVCADDRLVTPDPDLGAVRGVGLAILLDEVDELESAELSAADLHAAHELIAINAVRGARPITRLDGRPVGDASVGPWARRLDALLANAP
ncbi:MAG: hypothetical protein GY944_00585 [bacterium]|nr:hypothetical protein [bacterium]